MRLSQMYKTLPSASDSAMGEQTANVGFQRRPTSRPNLGVVVGAAAVGALLLIAVGIMAVMLIRRLRRSTENLHRAVILPEADEPAYREHDPLQSDSRSVLSSTDSATLENDRPPTPFSPLNCYSHPFLPPTSISLTNGDTSSFSVGPVNVSPTNSIPPVEFPTFPSINQPLHRIFVTGTETHLIGSDNSIAHFARQQMAEREAELTRRMHKTEAALPAKYGVLLSSVNEASISVGLSSGSTRGSTGSSSNGSTVAGLQTPEEGIEGGDRADARGAAENGAILPDGSEHRPEYN